jgi:hypothetical protein
MANPPGSTFSPSGRTVQVRSTPNSGTVDPFLLHYVDAKIDKVRAEMNTELTKLESVINKAETQRSADYQNLISRIDNVSTTLPTKDTVRNWVLTGFGLVLAVAALGWSIFDTGTAIPGAFADEVLKSREQAQAIADQNAALDAKLDMLIKAQVQENDHARGGPQQGQARPVH